MATRLTMLYGPSGSGKTGSLIAMLKQAYADTGKRARVCVGDGSLANYLDSGLIEAGILDVCDYSAIHWPMSVTNRLAEGWWPTKQDDDGVWRATKAEELQRTPPEMLATFSFCGFEALSTMIRDYLMGNIKGGLAEQSARGIKVGQDSPFRIMDAEVKSIDSRTGQAFYDDKTGTGEVFGGNPMSHFNVAQTHALGVVDRSKNLPGWVVWTSHEKLGEEKRTEGKGENAKVTVTGDTAIGPEVAGGALSLTISRKFNDTLHHTVARKTTSTQDATTTKSTKDVKDEYRVYFRDHFDPDGVVVAVPYKAIVRCDMPDLLPATGYFTGTKPGEAVMKLYATVAEARKRLRAEAEALKAKREGVRPDDGADKTTTDAAAGSHGTRDLRTPTRQHFVG